MVRIVRDMVEGRRGKKGERKVEGVEGDYKEVRNHLPKGVRLAVGTLDPKGPKGPGPR